MEVAPSGPPRRGTPLPLGQLVEERRSRAGAPPNHLLESKIYVKLQSNSLIQAEPPVLHFSGFELRKDYTKTLKLINISSEVMNIHIIPTQTKHFQTTYTKKYRLIPGLAYTLKVEFCPDEWRYFYDCIRVHCKGEENLLIPVHAYPVIDDLHIPPRIDLSAVPLGQSVCHVIPLRCSCPIDFEFQVHVIQPHKAFSIQPLTGVIPANGEAKITVTFSPFQYETSQVTLQLVVSQFNTKPYLCTVTGSSAPRPALSQLERKSCCGAAVPPGLKGNSSTTSVNPRRKTKYKSVKESDKSKGDVKHGLKAADVCTPAGVAKMLIKGANKLSSKDVKEAVSCGSAVGLQSRQMKEALFTKKVQQSVKEEQVNHLKWQVHLGMDPMSEQTRRQVVEEREIALHEYMVKRGEISQEDDFTAGQTRLYVTRVLREAGQVPEGAPSFQFYTSFQWELRQRAFGMFQQAARKVAIRCRMSRRLACLRKLADSRKNLPSAQKADEEETRDLKISPDKVFPSSFPIFCNEEDPLARCNLAAVPVDAIDAAVTAHIPFFKLRVPQHYKLMGYQPVLTWEAFNSYISTALARPLRTGSLDALVRDEARAAEEEQRENEEEEEEEEEERVTFSFTAPEALLKPPPANPLRIFNPAPGLHAYKPRPKYLETDLDFHLCPLPRYSVPESDEDGEGTRAPQKDTVLIPEVMTWKNFDSVIFNVLSSLPALTSDCIPRRSVDYNTDILPLAAPSPIAGLPDDQTPPMDTQCEGAGVHLTPEMIRAEFLSGEALPSYSDLTSVTAVTHQRERQIEAAYRSEYDQMGKRVMARLKQFELSDATPSQSPEDDCK
ncbi:cilia- and flagella-associated protein 221 [Mugil cephalus]|uniref:cilia- and flagella-associated protein 221 n=1 Tax=Mugil cephalus TaxID=48193 RepID=UPI001FB5F6F1|nr:cilia- and flagella-associated protein 221 [Mugil cephalus]